MHSCDDLPCAQMMTMAQGEQFVCQKPASHDGEHAWRNLHFSPDYLWDVTVTWKPNKFAKPCPTNL